MKPEHRVNLVTPQQKRVLASLADELQRSVKESKTALRTALAEVRTTVAQLARRRFAAKVKR